MNEVPVPRCERKKCNKPRLPDEWWCPACQGLDEDPTRCDCSHNEVCSVCSHTPSHDERRSA